MVANEGAEDHSDQTTLRESDSSRPPPSSPASPVSPPSDKMSWLRKTWASVKVSQRDLKNIFKISIPGIIGLAVFQSDFFANYFTTNGYINALVAVAVLPTLPRARFLHIMVQCIFAICLATAVGLLALYCGIQARLHTTNPAAPPERYNSSQAAVMGVWLLFTIWAGSTFKSAYPTTMMPVLLFELYLEVACTSGINFPTMDAAMEFSNKLIVNFLWGLALSTGVSLLIFPVSCRTVFFESLTGYLGAVRGVMKTQQAYFHSIQDQDPWSSDLENTNTAELIAHKQTLGGLYGAAAKMRGELEFAGKEMAFAKLNQRQLSDLSDQALRIMPAFSGLGFIYDVLGRPNDEHPVSVETPDEKKIVGEWKTIMHALHEPIVELSSAMDMAIEHILLTLQLKKRPKGENVGPDPVPGSANFLKWYDEQTYKFSKTREVVARLWFEKEGVRLPDNFLEAGHKFDDKYQVEDRLSPAHRKPFTVIYIHYLLYAASREIFDLVTYADSMVADGTLSKRRFISPSLKHLRKWIAVVLQTRSDNKLSPHTQFISFNGTQPMPNPQTKVKRDPEHLPATRWWQVAGNYIRLFSKLMRSSHATHGLRVACAVMSVAVGFYIRTSSEYFSTNRWLWAMFAVILAMNRTAGFSLFLYVCRVGGTMAAMGASFAIYYMVVGHTVGVLIMLWVWFMILAYLTIRFPFYLPALVVTSMATIVMVGNELQDKKLGFARVTGLGQAAHEEYLMAPERLGIVAAGIGIAFFWTIFPYPLSEHTELRQDLASTLYYLASHHSMITKTVTSRAAGSEPHMASRNQNDLARARVRSFTKLQFLFGRLKTHLKFTKFQIILGGKFPTAQYAEFVTLCEKICTAANVIGYSSTSFVRAWEDGHIFSSDGAQPRPEFQWMDEFRSLSSTVEAVSNEVVSALVMLSNHMASGAPFPPNTKYPEEAKMTETIHEVHGNMMKVSHITEPGYAAFVTMTMAGRGIKRSIKRQMELCKELVGVLDFSSYVDIEKGGDRLDEEEKAEQMGPTSGIV